MRSIYELVYDYGELCFEGETLMKEDKRFLLREFKTLINRGWTDQELFDEIRRWMKRNEPTLEITSIFNGKRPKERNLLRHGKFYYHNFLRLTTSAPVREIDYDSGTIINRSEPYFLEMRSSLVTSDIVEYYCRQFRLQPTKLDYKRMLGVFTYLTGEIDIEILLFCIDIAANTGRYNDRYPPKSPLDIMDYVREAKEIYYTKKTETLAMGGCQIVKRKRMQRS